MAEVSQDQGVSLLTEEPVTNELRNPDELLSSTLQENERLRMQILTLRAKNVQLATWLGELQTLTDTLKRLADVAMQETV